MPLLHLASTHQDEHALHLKLPYKKEAPRATKKNKEEKPDEVTPVVTIRHRTTFSDGDRVVGAAGLGSPLWQCGDLQSRHGRAFFLLLTMLVCKIYFLVL
jgi:hypothetical protein